jgi:hypothetical protein
MTKHILDRPRTAASERTVPYTRLERDGTAHPATRDLQRRNRQEQDAGRMKVYSRLDRTQSDD